MLTNIVQTTQEEAVTNEIITKPVAGPGNPTRLNGQRERGTRMMIDHGQDTDILQPDPVRQGGLVQRNMVSPVLLSNLVFYNISQQHTFRKPATPLEPPTPRVSALGLDRLAIEKRAASSQGDGNGKRQRLDSREPHFKGM